MTLAGERELKVVREDLTYVTGDRHGKDPHWHASYPWLEDPASLPNNNSGSHISQDREAAIQGT